MEDSSRSSMASISVWLGITSILFYSTGVVAIILGGISIVLALLSRGNSKKLIKKAKIGLAIGIAGVVITYVTVGIVAYRILSDPAVVTAIRDYMNSATIENYNGLRDVILGSVYN